MCEEDREWKRKRISTRVRQYCEENKPKYDALGLFKEAAGLASQLTSFGRLAQAQMPKIGK